MNSILTLKPFFWAKTALYGVLFLGVYYTTFVHLIMHGWVKDDYTYCYLIPLIVLYLIWEKRDALLKAVSNPSWTGLTVLLAGLLLFWLGELGGEFYMLFLSSWFVLIGLCLMHFGWKKFKIIVFPIFFIITMFPPPDFIYFRLSLFLKLISSTRCLYNAAFRDVRFSGREYH